MPHDPLAAHAERVTIGAPLPFDILAEDGRLLLARGQRVSSAHQMASLLERGALVRGAGEDGAPDPDTAAGRIVAWERSMHRARSLLASSLAPDFPSVMEEAAAPIVAMIERDPDLAIFQLVRPTGGGLDDYASRHAVNAAIAAHMGAARLGWSGDDRLRAFRAALTMNVGMVELQNTLAAQAAPPTPLQREAIKAHPLRSARMLEEVGITDADWLRAVREHHEYGARRGGYPGGDDSAGELARLVQRADTFTAKYAGRRHRAAMPADAAARAQYAQDRDSALSAALIKEFGLYPPGTALRLKDGSIGIVARRGASALVPVVVRIADAKGQPLPGGPRRATDCGPGSIVQIVPDALIARVPFDPAALIAAAED